MRLSYILCFIAVSTTASAGTVQRFVDVHGGCRGTTYSVIDMLESHISMSDRKFLGKDRGAWTEADVDEFKKIYALCLQDHPGHLMNSFRLGEPIVAPAGAIEKKVNERAREIRNLIIEPGQAARSAEVARREAIEDTTREAERDRLVAERETEDRRRADSEALQKRQSADALRQRMDMEKQALRDREAASQAQTLASQEAPRIASAEKEAREAHECQSAIKTDPRSASNVDPSFAACTDASVALAPA